MPKVSIILGIYNCAPYLQEALDSLYNQSFKDFEIILCDDGSKDNTYAVAADNVKEHKNIVLLRNERNMGLNITLNKCLSVASGEYIARMDGDDVCDELRLEKEVIFLDTHPDYAIVSTPMFYFDDKGIFMRGTGGYEPHIKDFAKGTPFCHAPCMVRKEAYEAVGGYSIDPRLLRVEDYHLWIKMYKAGFKGYVLEEPLYSMRDDRSATKRRSFRNRMNEVYVRYLAITRLDLPFYNYIYCLKPFILAFVPGWIYTYLHRKKMEI